MEERFIQNFKFAIESEDDGITLETRFRDLAEWDSLNALSVIAMLDEEYDVIIEGNDFVKIEPKPKCMQISTKPPSLTFSTSTSHTKRTVDQNKGK